MGRTVTWILLGLGLAAVAAFLVLDPGAPPSVPDGLDVDDANDAAGKGTATPALQGSARRPPAERAAGENFLVHGRVLDATGSGLAGVPVEALRAGPGWDRRNPASYLRDPKARARKTFAALDDPHQAQPTLEAGTRSGSDGSFRLPLSRAGRYDVHARPVPPHYGSYEITNVHAGEPDVEITLHAFAGSRLEGRVIDAGDAPVAARLQASWWDSRTARRRWSSPLMQADASTGRFTCEAVPPGSLNFTVYLPGGRKLSFVPVKTPHEGEVVIRIPSGGSAVRGRITDVEQVPVSGAAVMVAIGVGAEGQDGGERTFAKALSDASGTYTISGVPPGTLVSVEVLADGFLHHRAYDKQADWVGGTVKEGGTLALDVTLKRGGKVHGRILASGDAAEQGIAGASVRLLPARAGMGMPASSIAPVETDDQGAYAFAGVAEGRYVVLPEHPRHYLPELAPKTNAPMPYGQHGGASPASLTVVITGDASDVTRDVHMARGLPVRGRVVDPQGTGVADAEIKAQRYGLGQVVWRWGIAGVAGQPLATSAVDGAFEILGLPPGEDWVLYPQKEGWIGVPGKPFTLTAGAPIPAVELAFRAGATLQGRVVGVAASKVVDAHVGAWGTSSPGTTPSRNQRVKADGTFELRNVPPGDVTLYVMMAGRTSAQKKIKDLQPGEVRAGIELEFAKGVEVSGVLVDAAGKGVRHVSLALQSVGDGRQTHATTDAEGAFLFQAAKAGPHQLMTWGGSTSQRLGDVFTAPKTDLRIVYEKPPDVVITGTVLDPAGAPVPFCFVRVKKAQVQGRRGAPMPQVYGRADAGETVNGTFRQRVTGKGPWTVEVSNPRGEDGSNLNLVAAPVVVTDPSRPAVVHMESGLEITGSVVDGAGKPLAGVGVLGGSVSASTDADGRFALTGLRAGRLILRLQQVKGYVQPKTRQVAAGTRDVEFRLERGLTIAGKAVGPDDKPLARGYVRVTWKKSGSTPAGSSSARLLSDGTFKAGGIPAGVRAEVRVQQYGMGGDTTFAPVVLEGVTPGTEDLVVRLGAGVSIRGVVVTPDGKPAPQCYVNARTVGESRSYSNWAQTDDTGAWTIGGLEAGRYTIHVQRPGGGTIPAAVEVEAPSTGVRIVLPESASISGRVEGLGTVVPGWSVSLRREDGSVAASAGLEADGSFRFAAVAVEGRYRLAAQNWQDPRYAESAPVEAGAENVVLRLEQGLRITGTIDRSAVDSEAGCSVQAHAAGWRSMARVDKETGRFEILGLRPGRYVVKARLYDGTAHAVQGDVEAGTEKLTLRLSGP